MKPKSKSATPFFRKDKQKMRLTTSNKTGNVVKFDADARREYLLGMGKRKAERQVIARELQKLKEDAALQEKKKQSRMQDKKLWEEFEAKMKQNDGDDEENEEDTDEVGMIIKKEDKSSTKVIDYQRNSNSSSEEEGDSDDEQMENEDSEDEEAVSSVRVTVQPMSFGNDNLLQIMNEKEEIAQEVYKRKQQIKEEQQEELEAELALKQAKHFMNEKTHLKTIPGISQLQMTAEELDKKVMEFKKEQKMKKITIQAKSKANKSTKKRSKMLQKMKNKRKSKE